jgi:hypothetical protein
MTHPDYTRFGGRRILHGADGSWDFGWRRPDVRTATEHACHGRALAAMPEFLIEGAGNDDKKVCLWDCWRHSAVVATTGGKPFPGFHQLTGSCVGAGGGNTVFSLAAVEVVRLGDPEQALVPFWPLPYGRSRVRAGIHGRGEGSIGSAFAEAMREDGIIEASADGLPKFRDDDGIYYTSSVEMTWSDGDRVPAKYAESAHTHLVKTTAPLKNADQLREAIRNYYPCSFAGDWGGLMECPTAGTPPVLLNRHADSWSHQQSVHGWWDHPTLGEIFYVMNQWGLKTHGICPSGAPPGGYWIKKADAEYQCRTGEVFAFSQFQGFPAQKFSWGIGDER